MMKTLSLFLLLLILATLSRAIRQSHVVHWNISNPIFRIDNTDHIMDVNHGNQPWEYDQVNIICPNYPHRGPASEEEKYIIYNVNKEEYQTCRIMNPNPRVIAVCDKPHELLYFTISFRSFTPTPGGMEFKPGRDYYFISTSSPTDLRQTSGGRCRTHNMKVAFKVAPRGHERERVVVPNVNSPRQRLPPPFRATPTTTTVAPPPSRKQTHKIQYGFHPRGGGYQYPPKRIDEYDIHPNEVVKHEASRMASKSQKHSLDVILLLLASSILIVVSRMF